MKNKEQRQSMTSCQSKQGLKNKEEEEEKKRRREEKKQEKGDKE